MPEADSEVSDKPSWFEQEALKLLSKSIDSGLLANKEVVTAIRAMDVGQETRHAELLKAIKGEPKPAPTYPMARFGDWLEKRPQYIQNAFGIGVVIVGLQLVGALYEKVTGHAPPQVTVPTSIVSSAGALTIPPSEPEPATTPVDELNPMIR